MSERIQSGPPGKFQFIDVTDATFERDVLKSGKPAYVLFYSNTCGACRDMQTTLEQIGIAFKDRLTFYRVDVTSNQAYLGKYASGGGLPLSVILGPDGEVVRNTRIMDGRSVWSGDAANLQYFINWLNNVLNIIGENW